MLKDVLKSLIVLRQRECPFDVIPRELKLPIDRRKIITVPGVRRCGKSTMMELAINELLSNGVPPEKILWMGFDDERLRHMKAQELDEVIRAYTELYPEIPLSEVHMFFDEVQLIPDWEYFVLRIFERYCRNIFVCGSNASMLSPELFRGSSVYPLRYGAWPLSFAEFCRFRGIDCDNLSERDLPMVNTAFDGYNRCGGFPMAVRCPKESKRMQILQDHYKSMLLEDFCRHYGVKHVASADFFIKRLMENVSKPTSVNKIYGELKSLGFKAQQQEIYAWADHVCDIFLFRRIPKYEKSLNKETHALYKYYCIDNGLRSAVLLPKSGDEGKLLENTVLLQLLRNASSMTAISYYKGKKECDFVRSERDEAAELIQVCWTLEDPETLKREVDGLVEAAAVTGCRDLKIITRDEARVIMQGDLRIRVIPVWHWLLETRRLRNPADMQSTAIDAAWD